MYPFPTYLLDPWGAGMPNALMRIDLVGEMNDELIAKTNFCLVESG
jgi:hypothetical protein|tara:strand:- start:1895 stop:2032 length:138 start_codon:yes stop_codon:yes gene_type:complete